MKKRYGLPTAIAMVVGIVIGSGVFIKGGKVLAKTGGDLMTGLLAILLCGVICIICSLVFAELSSKYNKVSGVVDYAEAALGNKYAYYVGWFMSTIYTPSIATVVAFFSGLLFCNMCGWRCIDLANGCFSAEMVAVGAAFLFMSYAINALSPKLAGKLQVSMLVVKLVPLLLIGIVGCIIGLSSGASQNVLNYVNTPEYVPVEGGFFKAVVGFAFAFEGWILATTINEELEKPQRNLPLALIFGSLFVVIMYMVYIFAMSATGDANTILGTWPLGQDLSKTVALPIFGPVVTKIFEACIVVSCLGTLNGVIMSHSRAQYAIASRGMGPLANEFRDIDKQTEFPIKSTLFAMAIGGFWYAWMTCMYWNGPDFFGSTHTNWFFGWEPDETCIVTLYAMYIPMFVALIVKCKEFNFLKRYVIPVLGIACCVFLIVCCWVGWGTKACIGYLVFFTVVMIVGRIFMHPEKAVRTLK